MKKIVSIILGSMLNFCAYAENYIDVYGVDSKSADKIVQKYGKEIAKLHQQLIDNIEDFKKDDDSEIKKKLRQVKASVIDRMKKEYHLIYVHWDTVFYPDSNKSYLTLEVIKQGDERRLEYVDAQVEEKDYPKKNDLIQKMTDYEDLAMSLALNKEIAPTIEDCPFYHCILGFKHPQLAPYKTLFIDGVKKDRQLILETLNKDPNPQRRASAAFLVGCFNEPQKIIKALLPRAQDKNGLVRNNAIRVIAATMEKAKIQNMELKPFIALLNSPQDSDRNKSLLVLLYSAKSEKTQKMLIKDAGNQLLNLLALKQPNNHSIAYSLLKKISHQNFAEYDLASWEKWIHNAQKAA